MQRVQVKKHLKDTNFKERERIRIKEYREKKKQYQSEAEKLSQHEKEKLRKQKNRLAKKQEKKYFDNIRYPFVLSNFTSFRKGYFKSILEATQFSKKKNCCD